MSECQTTRSYRASVVRHGTPGWALVRAADRDTALTFLLILGEHHARAKSTHPCFGCGAPSTKRCAQPSVHCGAGAPSKAQNCVVLYSACTGWPAAPLRISTVLGRFVIENASGGAEQIRSPLPQIWLVRSFRVPKPPGRGPVIDSPNIPSGMSLSVISAPWPS